MRGDWFSGEQHQSFARIEGDSGALLLHGFMGTPAELHPISGVLEQNGFSTYGPLLPGFGERVDTLSGVGREEWIGEPGQLWEELHRAGKGQVLVGFSMGGAIALNLARQYPPERLILLAPLWKVMGGDWRLRLLPVLKRFVKQIQPFAGADLDDPEIRTFFADAMPDLDLDDPDVREIIRNEITLSTSTLDELRHLAASTGELAPEIDVPTLVIQGKTDTSVRCEDTRSLVDRMNAENTEYVEVDAGHMLVADSGNAWEEVRDLIVNFVNGRNA